jgi:Glycosyl transferases, related to UDP-glucuronosyltransferase
MIIRLYPEDYGWNQKQRWLERFPQISLDEGNVSYSWMIKKCRLFISTYMATTYNESLAANIPTVIYWNPNQWKWSDSAESDFIALKSVGIFHDTPGSAAQHVTRVWEDVAAWWYSSEVQTVRELFCRKYAHRGKDVIPKLAAVLKEAAHSNHL